MLAPRQKQVAQGLTLERWVKDPSEKKVPANGTCAFIGAVSLLCPLAGMAGVALVFWQTVKQCRKAHNISFARGRAASHSCFWPRVKLALCCGLGEVGCAWMNHRLLSLYNERLFHSAAGAAKAISTAIHHH